MSNIPKDLPERIKYLREQKDMSQSDLAKRIGIDSSRLSRIENGEIQKVSDDVVLAIAQIFEVSTDFLLGVTDDPVPSNFHINELGLSVDAAKKIYSGAYLMNAGLNLTHKGTGDGYSYRVHLVAKN